MAGIGCSRSTQSYIGTGNRLSAEGKYEEAILNYRNAIKKEPRSAEARFRLGLAESELGHIAAAYRELQTAVQLAPARDDIRVKFADAALAAYDASASKPKVVYDQITRSADYFLSKNPASFDGLRLRGDLFSIDGRLDEALDTFRKANAIKPLETGVILPMIQVLMRQNKGDEGERIAKQFLQVHRDNRSVYAVLLRYYTQSKRTTDAENLLIAQAANRPKDAESVLQLASFYRGLQREADMSRTLQTISANSKDFPGGHAILGQFYAGSGRWDDALREYSVGLQFSRGKDRVSYQKLIVKVLGAQGKRKEAIEQLNQILRSNADDMDARTARAILLQESNDAQVRDFAISELNAVIGKNSSDEIVRYNLGLAYLAKGEASAAHAQLTQSAELQKTYAPPRLALAEMALKTRNPSETVRWAGEVLSFDTTNTQARILRCAGLIGLGDYMTARTELEQLEKQLPNSLDINLHLAVINTAEKRFHEAEARYLRFYKPGQQDMRPLEGLVQLYSVQRQADKSMRLVEEEVKKLPDSLPVHMLLANTAAGAGKMDIATKEYEWLRVHAPQSPEVFISLAGLYQAAGDATAALANYQKARELAPNNPNTIGEIGFLQLVTGQQDAAIKTLRQKLRVQPEDAEAMNNLAYALAETGGNLDEALILAEKAQRKVPNNPGIDDTLAWVYTRKGLNDSAVQIFHNLVRKYPDQPVFRYHLGVALLQRGQPEEAKSEFIISLSKAPPKDIADKIKLIIAKIG